MKSQSMRYLILATFLAFTAGLMAQDYPAAYQTIEQLNREGKYRSALEEATKIYERAATVGDEDQMLKALAHRAAYTFQLEEDGYEATLRLLLVELRENPDRPAVAPVLHFLVGQGYYYYAQQNSYRLRNATAISQDTLPGTEVPLADWNLRQLGGAASEHLLRSLELAREQRTRLSEIPAIVTGDAEQYVLRPTLYDLLALDAMDLLSNPLLGIGAINLPEETDYLLLPAPEFTQLDLSALEEDNLPVYRKLVIYQDLLAFHLEDKSPALLLHDRQRVAYARELGAPDSQYLAALEQMLVFYENVPLRDMLLLDKAALYNRSDEEFGARPKVKALAILDEVTDETPRVANVATGLRRQITATELRVNTQTAYGKEDNILIQIDYRNVERVYHRLISAPDNDPAFNSYNVNEKQLKRWKKQRNLARVDFRLPENDDYEMHQTETWLKAQQAGVYYLLTSTGPKFDLATETVAVTRLQISDLALVEYSDGEENPYLKVLDRTTGAPVSGVAVTIRERNNRRNADWKPNNTHTTGTDGRFPKPQSRNGVQVQYRLDHRGNKDRYVSDVSYVYDYDNNEPGRIYPLTPLFTDRSIYRPGQTVHVYGVTLRKLRDQMPELLTDTRRELTLYDVNGQEMGRADVRSDAFSRFSHSFKLPEGGLTGNFRIQTEGGSVSFRVEEYKRPRFEVELTAPDYAVAGEMAIVEGQASLYAGPGLNDARVSYRVFLEEIRYWWWGRGNNNERELVDSGETTTADDGTFNVPFTPAVNLSQQRRRYRYVMEVDVSDETGETHAAETSVALRAAKPVISVRPVRETLDVADSLTVQARGSDENLSVTYRIVRVEKPDAALQERKWGFPDRPVLDADEYRKLFPELAATAAQPLAEWQQVDRLYHSGTLELTDGEATDALDLGGFQAGHYRIEWTYPDGTAGEPTSFRVVNVAAGRLPAGMLYHVNGLDGRARVGKPLEITLVSALDLPHVVYGWASRKGYTTDLAGGGKKTTFRYVPTERDRGGIQFNAAFLRLNANHQLAYRFPLPWDNKKMQIDYATFRDKLRPGAPERWTLTVRNADGSPVAAAALASMYDASLDQIYAENNWGLNPFPSFNVYRNFANLLGDGTGTGYGRTQRVRLDLPSIAPLPGLDLLPFSWFGGRSRRVERKMLARSAPAGLSAAPQNYSAEAAPEFEDSSMDEVQVAAGVPPPAPAVEENKAEEPPVQIRKNLQETAFWFPELTSNDAGELTVSFTSPEALTSWNFRVLAHDKDLNTAVSTKEIVTQKELMVLPNVPRFVREGDEIELTARVNNLTDAATNATVSLEFFDPTTNEPLALGAVAGAGKMTKEQSIAAQSGISVSFPLSIPDGLSSDGPIGYRIIARALSPSPSPGERGAQFSDGEENVIPVLTDRTLITVGQPFYLKRKEKKTVTLPLLASNDSETLQHVGYTFQATTNPAWLALKALPYLMEYPYDCTEQLANRYFANQLAFTTVSQKPILEEVFRRWRADTNALKSELERNPSLKNALLTETPWLRAAKSESEQRARIGELFDLKKLADEQVTALEKLANRQDPAGYFSWFPGGRENRYMTQYVVETLARMQQLGVVTPDQRARVSGISKSAIAWLDEELKDDYRRLLERMKDEKDWKKDYRPSSSVVHYLYARSQVRADVSADKLFTEALSFYQERSRASWLGYGLYEQALIAITYARPQQAAQPQDATTQLIIESLRERAIRKDEFGMYWKYGRGFRWQNLPIETHCRILEAFEVAGGAQEELDEMRLWLLTNKRTNRWPTTKATAAAVYALLNTGSNWTQADGKPLKVKWADSDLLGTRVSAAQESPEAATGAFSVSAKAGEVSSALASVQVKNRENELVWGGVYWQYTELAEKVQASNDGPLILERELFRRVPTDDGMRLEPITPTAPLKAGDRVTVRLILRSDRELDFVHLKDRRAATFEPIEQLSGYQYKNGLGYYFAPGDLATNFFIDHLSRGTYTLEYDLFATYSGSFSNGLGRVQCMYAPEFGGNTSGARIVVE